MVRILSGSKLRGLPGFKRVTIQGTGGGVPKDTAGKSGIRRLSKRDPADGNLANIGTAKDVPLFGKVVGAVNATLTTAMAGANNDLVFTAKVGGVVGNSTRVRIVVAGNNTALSVAVSGADITINSATDGAGLATTTALEAIAAVEADVDASALVWVALKAGESGAGVIAAFAYTALSGGAEAVTTEAGDVNTVPPQSPGVVSAPNLSKGNAEPVGRAHVLNRSTNRRIRKR